MLIGLLSDSHDRFDAAMAAVRTLQEAGAEFFIHAGDVGGDRILDLLGGLPSAFVWGNNDWDRASLAGYADSIGVKCLDASGELTLDNKLWAVTHGDDASLVQRILRDQKCDYLITGHTHVQHDQRVGRVRWINPGALYRAREKTVALLDTQTDALRFITLSV